jgi:hypothetical protein
MFTKSSTLNKSINNRVTSLRFQKIFSDPNFTKLTLLTVSTCLVIYLILPCKTQYLINSVLKHPLIVSSLIVLCLVISIINMPVGISLLIFLAAVYFGQNGYLSLVCNRLSIESDTSTDSNDNASNDNIGNDNIGNDNIGNDNVVKEGFKSKSYKEDIKEKEEELYGKIKSLFSDGPFSKSIDEYKSARKELLNEDMAETNMEKYEYKLSKSKTGGGKKNKETFNDTSSSKKKDGGKRNMEKFQSIPMRKFNPADKDDTNLLLVMEHCKDIQNRIEYEYEDITYLKKYIKDKLEKIIDLLELVDDE